jgi:hypothetical protein
VDRVIRDRWALDAPEWTSRVMDRKYCKELCVNKIKTTIAVEY